MEFTPMKESRYNVWVELDEADYVFNGVSGALLRMPRSEHQALTKFLNDDENADCPPELLEQLVRGHMLIGDSNDELALLSKRYEATRNNTSSFGLTIVTSLGCNFDCPYCFEAKHPSILDGDVQQAVLEVVDDQLPRVSNLDVTWFGGEPLVGKKPLLALSDAFIERCDRAQVGYSATIVTNGYLLDEETCMQLRDRRVISAQTSLDGPPEVHNRMRPLAGGKPTFWQIVKNLHHAVDYLDISVRMNVDRGNFSHAEDLLKILANEGLAGRLTVYPGHITGNTDNLAAPSANYRGACFTKPDFAQAELEFKALAMSYGFSGPSLPRPSGAPCTAVRSNTLVVGSKGELYKCWDSVGNRLEVIGHISDYRNTNGRLAKWMKYDPFSNKECRGCIALPVCMGGCAHHAFELNQYENRCGSFRFTYHEQILSYVEAAEKSGFRGTTGPVPLQLAMETR
jgi:uncharacterized protein